MNVSTPYVCATCRPTRTNWFDSCRHATLTDPVSIADTLMYERQYEWFGWFSIDRFKLRALIIEAILDARDAGVDSRPHTKAILDAYAAQAAQRAEEDAIIAAEIIAKRHAEREEFQGGSPARQLARGVCLGIAKDIAAIRARHAATKDNT